MSAPIRAAVISAGAWSQSSHLPALKGHPGVDLIALSSPNASTAASLAKAFDVPNAFTDWRSVLALKPAIVVVSSPPVAHEEQVTAALEAGAHVLVEKPFALDGGAAARMRERKRRIDCGIVVARTGIADARPSGILANGVALGISEPQREAFERCESGVKLCDRRVAKK